MTTTELFESVRDALDDFALATARGDHAVNWHALRVRPDGTTHISEEASPCYSESEYYSRTPHELTIAKKTGDGWTPSPTENPGWLENDDGTLDLEYWVGDSFDVDELYPDWKATLQAWIDNGNFTPTDS